MVNWTPTTVYLVWSPTKHNILHLILQFVPQGNVQELPIRNQDSPYQGFCRSEVHVRCLRFRPDSQSLLCVHSVGLRCSWLFMTVFLIISRGPTLFIFLYMSFAYAAHDECSCLSFISLRIHYRSSVTSLPLGLRLF